MLSSSKIKCIGIVKRVDNSCVVVAIVVSEKVRYACKKSDLLIEFSEIGSLWAKVADVISIKLLEGIAWLLKLNVPR